uniref:O-antigen ligase family protein n=1 Tax=Ndongobacter massiliensis TaxID=1871025 RepID=UPI00092FDCDB|nr:O-antigen ligase family protein [Ndongobacter massiliensis]
MTLDSKKRCKTSAVGIEQRLFFGIKRIFDAKFAKSLQGSGRVVTWTTFFLVVFMTAFTYTGLSAQLVLHHRVSGTFAFFINLAFSGITFLIYLLVCNGPVLTQYIYSSWIRIPTLVITIGFAVTGVFISHTKLFYSAFMMGVYYLAWQIIVTGRVDFFLNHMAKGLAIGGSTVLLLSFIFEPIGIGVYFGIFDNPNGLALLSALTMFSGFALTCENRAKRSTGYVGYSAGILGFLCGCCTNSRTFILTLILAILFYILHIFRSHEKKKNVVILLKTVSIYAAGAIFFIVALRPCFYKAYQFQGALQQLYLRLKISVYESSIIDGKVQEAAAIKPMHIPKYPTNEEVFDTLFARTELTIAQGQALFAENRPIQKIKKKPSANGNIQKRHRISLYERCSETQWFQALDRLTSHRMSIWTIYMDNVKMLGQQKRQFELEGYSLPFFSNPHNLIISFFYDGGIPVGIAFFVLFLKTIFSALFAVISKRKWHYNPIFYLLLLSFFAPAMLGMGVDPFGNFVYFGYIGIFLYIACLYSKASNQYGASIR